MLDYTKNEIFILLKEIDKACKSLRRDIKARWMRRGTSDGTFTNSKLQAMMFELDRAVRENARLVRILKRSLENEHEG